ncbi:MAG: flagellar hook-associated protein FlgL [Deltaproteobacteria bacterium]|nr:flagellar hook-associated protein FlgL [Deltaproteobacteria bacterium]
MRVTTAQLFANASINVNQNRERYMNAQEALITNKKVNRPSDDPVGAARITGTRNQIGRFEQFQRNVGYARNFATLMESALSSVADDLTRARELATDINGGTAATTDFQAAAAEIAGIFQSVLKSANARDDRRYIFAGYETLTPPFDGVGAYSGGTGQSIDIEVTSANFVTINRGGDEVFKGPIDVFQVLTDLEAAIAAGDQTQISALIPQVEDAIEQVVGARSAIGAVTSAIDRAENANSEMNELMNKILSDAEDVDIAKATADFALMEQVYQATLLVSNRVVQQNLLDYF